MSDEFSLFEEDAAWVDEHRDALVREYPNCWIAVRGGRVVASDVDMDNLLSRIPDPAHTVVEFVNPEPLEIVL